MASVAPAPFRTALVDAVALAEAVRERAVSATELVTDALEAIAADACPGAFWAVDDAGALAAARSIDRSPATATAQRPLAGVPLAVKDCFSVRGLPTTFGLNGSPDPERTDATAVARLRRAGAIPIGKTAMNPLGWSTESEPPGWPRCVNPRYPSLATGGSSSGSAAAVAAGAAAIGLGTDVAGSVRIPAAYCGIFGFKPARGATPAGGMRAITPSFDLAGVLARSVRDCQLSYEIFSGRRIAPSGRGTGPVRVGRLADLFDASDPEVSRRCTEVLEAVGAGLQVETMRLDWKPEGFGRILAIELARTWGDEVERAPERFTDGIRASVEYGRRQSFDALEHALRWMARARAAVARRLAEFDVVVAPTVPHPAPPVSSTETVAEATGLTRIFSGLGWPALSIPCGDDGGGRPIALQIAAHPRRLDRLFQTGRLIEGTVRNGA